MLRLGVSCAVVVLALHGCGGGTHLHGRDYRDDEAHYRIGELGAWLVFAAVSFSLPLILVWIFRTH